MHLKFIKFYHEFQAKIKAHGYGESDLFEKGVFDPTFQREAVQLVVADTAGKYFSKVGGVLKEPEIACPADHVQAANAVLDQIEGYVALVGRKVKPLNGCPGSVAKYFGRASMFQVRYMHPANPKGRAKMLKRVTHEELMEIILPDTGEEDDNDDEVEESDEEVEEEEEEEEEDLEGTDD